MSDNILKKIYDKEFHEKISKNPKIYAEQIGYENLSSDVDVVVVKNTKDIIYMVMPEASAELDLSDIQAAGTSSSVSSGGTFSTATMTLGCASTLGTIGSAK